MFLKKILRVVVDFDKAPRLHLVTVPKSWVGLDLVKRTSSVCCGVETTNASSRCRVGLLSCAAVMKPLYKQEMYTLRSTVHVILIQSDSISFAVCVVRYLIVFVPPAFV